MGRLTKEEQKRRAELLAKGLKVCNECGRELPVEQFHKDKNRKDGLQPKCKDCVDINNKQYYQEHKEEIQQYGKQYYQENKEKIQQQRQQYRQEHKQEIQQYKKQHYQENKEKVLQYGKQYYQENKQYYKQYRQKNKEKKQQYDKQYKKQHYQENKEKRQQYYQQYHQTPQGQIAYFNAYARRRKREESQGNGITKDQWLEMMNFFDWKCAYSGILVNTKKNRSIDHIIPLVKGGEHEIWNLVPMDISLNKSKKDKDIMEWYTTQDFYSKERLDKILAWQQYAYNKYGKQEEAQ